MRAGSARVIVVSVGLWLGLASVTHAARIVDVRVAGHADYDRLVIEVEGDLQAFHQPIRSGERFMLELNAVPAKPILVLDTLLPRMGRVTIEAVSDGSLVSVQPRRRQVRAFLLTGPARVVVDFSSPDGAPLPIPEGASRLIEAIAPPWAALPEPEVPESDLLEPDPEPVAEIPVPDPDLPGPESVAELPTPEPTPQVGPAQPEPVVPAGDGMSGFVVALGLVAATAAVGLGWFALRRLRYEPPAEPAPLEAVPPDTITREELGRGTEDRLVALESRLDEEVRSRSRVEERLLSLHEDLKVVRDRLQRASRRERRGTDE